MIGEKRSHAILDRREGRDTGESTFQRALWTGLSHAPAAPSGAEPAAIVGGPVNLLGNSYTFTLIDSQDLISASIEAQITTCANYVINLVSNYIAWHGTLDFVVDIKPASASPYPSIDGILPAVAQIAWNGSAWINQTLEECLTGTDADPSQPDAGCTIYLAADGTIRNYGTPVWFDPNPQFAVDPDVPAGTHDFTGIYTHEVFHALGFYQVTQQWQDEITTQGALSYFEGETAVSLFGGPVPFPAGTDHYGYDQNPAIDISRGLMFQYGNYERNRLDIGRIDLAILADLGHSIKTYAGLPLFELIDTQLNLTGTANADRLYGDYHANILDGGAGADHLEGGLGDDIYHIDNAGDVVVELAGEGGDTIRTSIDYALPAGLSVETLIAVAPGQSAQDLTGNELANVLRGNDGANVLDGGGGNDSMTGFGGNDIYIVGEAGDQVVEGAGAGTDEIQTTLTSFSLGSVANVENLTGLSNLNSTLTGNAGANVIRSGPGFDSLIGGEGDDIYHVNNAQDSVTEGVGQGNDIVYARASWTLTAGQYVELLTGAPDMATTNFDLGGNELGNVILGNAGANALYGHGGDDRISGGGGNDRLIGGGGSDRLEGGAGSDVFAYEAVGDSFLAMRSDGAKFMPDVIMDFTPGQDLIDLSAMDANLATPGNDSFTFIGTNAFSGIAGQLRYESQGGFLILLGDCDGNGGADFRIVVQGAPALETGDFVF